MKKYLRMSSAAVVIGVLRAYIITGNLKSLVVHAAMHPNKNRRKQSPDQTVDFMSNVI